MRKCLPPLRHDPASPATQRRRSDPRRPLGVLPAPKPSRKLGSNPTASWSRRYQDGCALFPKVMKVGKGSCDPFENPCPLPCLWEIGTLPFSLHGNRGCCGTGGPVSFIIRKGAKFSGPLGEGLPFMICNVCFKHTSAQT